MKEPAETHRAKKSIKFGDMEVQFSLGVFPSAQEAKDARDGVLPEHKNALLKLYESIKDQPKDSIKAQLKACLTELMDSPRLLQDAMLKPVRQGGTEAPRCSKRHREEDDWEATDLDLAELAGASSIGHQCPVVHDDTPQSGSLDLELSCSDLLALFALQITQMDKETEEDYKKRMLKTHTELQNVSSVIEKALRDGSPSDTHINQLRSQVSCVQLRSLDEPHVVQQTVQQTVQQVDTAIYRRLDAGPPLPASITLLQPAPGAPAAQQLVLITAQPQSNSAYEKVPLPGVMLEARAVQLIFGEACAALASSTSFQQFGSMLAGRHTWWFSGHGDALLDGKHVLAFEESGQIEVVSTTTLVETVRLHAVPGGLKLIVLNGCKTLELGKRLRIEACVPNVICWKTKMHDDVGPIFGSALAEALKCGIDVPQAFHKARLAVQTPTAPGKLDGGHLRARVQKFELGVDPEDATRVNCASREVHSGDGKGRLAAGIPLLLDESAPERAVVPDGALFLANLSDKYVRRDLELDALVRVIVDADRTTSSLFLKGTSGLGTPRDSNASQDTVSGLPRRPPTHIRSL